jgi:hypothetical protein
MKKMVRDRRNGKERRVVRRYAVNIDIYWEGVIGRQHGTISDISLLGCFVLCSGEVEDGEKIKLFFPIGEKMKVQLQGEVVNHVFEIGFGIRFIELNKQQTEFLHKLIVALENKS